jgi:hypothetical protein
LKSTCHHTFFNKNDRAIRHVITSLSTKQPGMAVRFRWILVATQPKLVAWVSFASDSWCTVLIWTSVCSV